MKISVIIIAKNEDDVIRDCLKSVRWADEIILLDGGSGDNTVKIAKSFGAKVINYPKGKDFSSRRNRAAKEAGGKWLFYVDADERVTAKLKTEIAAVIARDRFSGYGVPRRNILLGHEMRWGGWWPDYVLRLIRKDNLIGWEGKLHEQPEINGSVGKLKEPLVHITHRDLASMVEKTNNWSEIEAKLLYEARHPPVVWWRLLSVAAREFWNRGILKLGFLDGPIGIIEIIYQMFSRMITYAKLWELQLTAQNSKPKSRHHRSKLKSSYLQRF